MDEKLKEGAYSSLAKAAIVGGHAKAAAVLLLDGYEGSGFSAATTSVEEIKRLPAALRQMAEHLERYMKEGNFRTEEVKVPSWLANPPDLRSKN